jgi:primary-amine oxidase
LRPRSVLAGLWFGAAAILAAPPAGAQPCSPPFLVEQAFPTAGPEETRWRVCWQMRAGNGLVITGAFFRKAPSAPWIQVLYEGRVAEIFVPYHSGAPRYYDVAGSYLWVTLGARDCPAERGGTLLGTGPDVCKEVRDRGLAWKHDLEVRRGEEVALWGTLRAANYNYILEWTFRDDGAIQGRVGATGSNAPSRPWEAHMHGPVWRLDVDLAGAAGDTVMVGRHAESGLTAVDSASPVATESGIAWDPLAFTTLHIHDAGLENARGHASAYHLVPLRSGTSRHQEPFTQMDFAVTRYRYGETAGSDLPAYLAPAEPVANADVVVWYSGGIHHLPRDEDGELDGLWFQGVAHVMWTGFLLKPHNLFDRTPLYP